LCGSAATDWRLRRGQIGRRQALLLAEIVRQGGFPEAMFGSKLSPYDAQRRTKTALALADGSLPGAAEALASGAATHAHVAALAEMNDRLPDGAAEELLPRAAELTPDKFRRAVQREAIPVTEVGDGSTGITNTGGRWFRFRYDGLDGTIVLNGLEATMDRAWRRDHPTAPRRSWTGPPTGNASPRPCWRWRVRPTPDTAPTVAMAPVTGRVTRPCRWRRCRRGRRPT
jgi:hypothetical protein